MNPLRYTQSMLQLFDRLCDSVRTHLQPGEEASFNLAAEQTLYLRFNGNRVRQSTDVDQQQWSMRLHRYGRTVDESCTLQGVWERDQHAVLALLQHGRAYADALPVDPHQVLIAGVEHTEESLEGDLPHAAQVVAAVVEGAAGCDLAGLYAGGVIIRAFAHSRGTRHWFATQRFCMDYSLYDGTRAVKATYAGSHWHDTEWQENLNQSRHQLSLMASPKKRLAPGKYRTYLAPRALSDLTGMLGWNALSAAAWKQGRSPLKRLMDGDLRLSSQLHINENFELGMAPRFNVLGETAPSCLPLVEAGVLRNLLVSSRSAKEYGLIANGAAPGEAPRALDVRPGTLEPEQVLSELGTGLLVSNLHYLNWSDPVTARITGMTRFACFWVEGGQVVAPIEDMRWDESLYLALGDKLIALTAHTELDPVTDTYGQRALGGTRTPGALIDDFSFTL